MSAIANIVVPDAAGTPVNHTFKPLRVDGDSGRWQENTTAARPAGYWQLAASLRAPKNGSAVFKQAVDLSIPVLKTYTDTSGYATVAVDYVLRARVEFLLPERSSLQDRKDLRKLLTGVLADAQVVAQIEALENAY
jgi:hypothetical protein